MYLSRLEMVGFKSFGLKTDLAFNDGVTAIVGPNGCGKTNIVDAIRWVLGEQKTSMLRADSMEHVIFNGSKTRKPLGMAEVSLTIENNRQILPTEYSQVVITRRLFRDGESQYLLNKTQCRLRDIVDLFMDTGMGADAYSVIELKMIETILSDKADERRHLFEEAAGVTKYKARRKEAQRKLEAAQRDIARVQDIVREVQKTVNSLSRQAEKARQHQDLSGKLRELEKLAFAFEYAEEFVLMKQIEERVAASRIRREAAEALLKDYELAEQAKEREYEQAEQDVRSALEAEGKERSSLESTRQLIALLDERIVANQRTHDRLDREHRESATQQSSTSGELQRVRDRLEDVKGQLESLVRETTQKQEAFSEASARLQSAKVMLDEKRNALSAAQYSLVQAKTQADRYHIQIESLQRRVSDNEVQQEQIGGRILEIERHVGPARIELDARDAVLQQTETDLHNAESRLNQLRSEQDSLQIESNTLRSALGHNSATLEFLSGLVDTLESSKFLLSTDEWRPGGDKLTLADVVDAPEELRVAIEAALGESARFFVVNNRSEADEAIQALSKNNVGKATFLCRDSIPQMAEPPSITHRNDILGWASELIRCDEQLRNAVRGILGRSVVVNNVDDAWYAISETAADAAVTLDGEIVHRSGAVRGGARTQMEGVRVGRKDRIKRLKAENLDLEAKLAITEQKLDAIKAELGSIDLRALGERVRHAAVERNEMHQRIEAFVARIEDLNAQRSKLFDEATGWIEERLQVEQNAGSMQHAIASLNDEVTRLNTDVNTAALTVQDTEQAVNLANAEWNAANIMVVRLDGERQSLESDEQRLSNQSLSLSQREERRNQELMQLSGELNELRTQRDNALQEAETQSARYLEAKNSRDRLEQHVAACSTALHAAAEAVRLHRKALEAIVTEMHELDIKHSEKRVRIESLIHRAAEELEADVPLLPQVPETEASAEQVLADMQEVRRKLTSMGNVNFLALEEHERENERLQFLVQQLDDLVRSERTLNETIAEINRTAREKFTSTFDRIRENFIMLFKILFSDDDEADLQMDEFDDHDPLECKIEIIAKPRGKRPHNIEMLSGGEKTLTAIALLFAIYLVKPSPFCILDEVDAPLDDANIDRYLKIIRKFSENTQFLMITHNKKTMEAADTLYGITMEEPAVSKVVSVQLGGERNAA